MERAPKATFVKQQKMRPKVRKAVAAMAQPKPLRTFPRVAASAVRQQKVQPKQWQRIPNKRLEPRSFRVEAKPGNHQKKTSAASTRKKTSSKRNPKASNLDLKPVITVKIAKDTKVKSKVNARVKSRGKAKNVKSPEQLLDLLSHGTHKIMVTYSKRNAGEGKGKRKAMARSAAVAAKPRSSRVKKKAKKSVVRKKERKRGARKAQYPKVVEPLEGVKFNITRNNGTMLSKNKARTKKSIQRFSARRNLMMG